MCENETPNSNQSGRCICGYTGEKDHHCEWVVDELRAKVEGMQRFAMEWAGKITPPGEDAVANYNRVVAAAADLRAKLAEAEELIDRVNGASGDKSFEAALQFHGLLSDVRRAALDKVREGE